MSAVCPYCRRPATLKDGHQILCAAHKRMRQMLVTARQAGKVAPSYTFMEAIVAECGGYDHLRCPKCERAMNWLRAGGVSTQATLQHNRNGTIQLLCRGCNSRHAAYTGDSFYLIPEGVKRCSKCGRIKPVDDFFKDYSARYMNRMSTCKECCAVHNAEWRAKNYERAKQTRRNYYHRRIAEGNPIPRA